MHIIEGHLNGQGLKVALIASRFNSFIVDRLIEGSRDCLVRHGMQDDHISLYKVPGAFELPALLNQLLTLKQKDFDGIICLGAVIRGETPHFDYVSAEVTKGIASLGMKSSIPVSFGVLTTDSVEQAIDRAGTKAGNKGFEAAYSLLEMVNIYKELRA
ncbi:MAG: 6,7-dimethyl-8-ribityllumazine synthase [Spirochaetae bacterium HGW-Spirochaetae-6]|nr:MAG: 6,7-dimethyl-8-ribityllumazine synthase [Spirochaetae bacterium HGW-Spirochaetae-6]